MFSLKTVTSWYIKLFTLRCMTYISKVFIKLFQNIMLLTMVASHSKQAAAVLHAPANFRIIAWTRHLLAPEIHLGRPHPRASPHPMTSPSASSCLAHRSIVKRKEKKKEKRKRKKEKKRICDQQDEELDLSKAAQRKVAQVWNCLECSQAGSDTIREKLSWTGDTSQSRTDAAREKGTSTAH